MMPKALSGTCLLALLISTASADVTVGGSRLAGMANAGIALPVDFGNVGQRNPAMYARLPHRLGLISPGLSGGLDGINTKDIGDFTKVESNGGGIATSAVNKLVQNYSGSNAELTTSANIGLNVFGFALISQGEAGLFSYPNAAMESWSKAGATGTPPIGASLDAYGYAYSSYDVGYGITERLKKLGSLDIGAQFNIIHFYYSHLIATGQGGSNGVIVTPASDMPIGKNFADTQSTSLDLGVHFAPTKGFFHYAAVLQNAVEPNISYAANLPNSVGDTTITPFKRQLNIGSAWTHKGTSAALDIQDIGNHADNSSIRGGIDTHLGALGIRAGYDTRYGATIGATVLGINFALSKRNDLSAAYAFRF